MMKKAFWGPGKAPRYANVKVTTATKSELNTFAGLVGYCSRNMEEVQFKCVHIRGSIELLQRGRDIHLALGAGGTYPAFKL